MCELSPLQYISLSDTQGHLEVGGAVEKRFESAVWDQKQNLYFKPLRLTLPELEVTVKQLLLPFPVRLFMMLSNLKRSNLRHEMYSFANS